MIWSNEIPKERGYFWCRSKTKRTPIIIFNEPEQSNVFATMRALDYYGAGYGHDHYECYGPIPEPIEE